MEMEGYMSLPAEGEFHTRLHQCYFWMHRQELDMVNDALAYTCHTPLDDLPEAPPWDEEGMKKTMEELYQRQLKRGEDPKDIKKDMKYTRSIRVPDDAPEQEELVRRVWAYLLSIQSETFDVPEWFYGGYHKAEGQWFPKLPKDAGWGHDPKPYSFELCKLSRDERVILTTLDLLHGRKSYPPSIEEMKDFFETIPCPPKGDLVKIGQGLVEKGYAMQPYGEDGPFMARRTVEGDFLNFIAATYDERMAFYKWRKLNPDQANPLNYMDEEKKARKEAQKGLYYSEYHGTYHMMAKQGRSIPKIMTTGMKPLYVAALTLWLDENEGDIEQALETLQEANIPTKKSPSKVQLYFPHALLSRLFTALGWNAEDGIADEALDLAIWAASSSFVERFKNDDPKARALLA